MSNIHGELVIFDVSPQDNRNFSRNVCEILGTNLGDCEVIKFKDKDTDIRVNNSVRGKDVFVFQSYTPPIGERKYELELFLDAVGPGGWAQRVTVVMPFLFGSRGERRTRARQAIPAGIVAKDLMNQSAGVLTVDVHAKAIETVYNVLGIRFENLEFEYLVANIVIQGLERGEDISIVTADLGGTKRGYNLRNIIAREYEERGEEMILPMSFANKYRSKVNESEIIGISGDVRDKDIYLIDDIGDTLGTVVGATRAYKDSGARSIKVFLCHPVLSEGSEENLSRLFEEELVDKLYFGNTIPLKPFVKNYDKINIIPLEPFVAEAIRRIHENISISQLRKYRDIMKIYGGKLNLS